MWSFRPPSILSWSSSLHHARHGLCGSGKFLTGIFRSTDKPEEVIYSRTTSPPKVMVVGHHCFIGILSEFYFKKVTMQLDVGSCHMFQSARGSWAVCNLGRSFFWLNWYSYFTFSIFSIDPSSPDDSSPFSGNSLFLLSYFFLLFLRNFGAIFPFFFLLFLSFLCVFSTFLN